MMRFAACAFSNTASISSTRQAIEKILRRGAVAQPRRILRRGDQFELGRLRRRSQFVELVVGIEMMVRERPRHRHRAAGLGDRLEKLVRMADAGEGQEAPVRETVGGACPGRGLEDRLAGARRLPHHRFAGPFLAHPHYTGGEADLIDQPARATDRPGGHGRCRRRSGHRPRPARSPCGAARSESRHP